MRCFFWRSNPFITDTLPSPLYCFLCGRIACEWRRGNWWKLCTSVKFIACITLCWASKGWLWINIIISVEHFRIICGSLLWSSLTMVLHWKMWLTMVEMKHHFVLVLSLLIVKILLITLKVTVLTNFVIFVWHISLVNVSKFLLRFFSPFRFELFFSSFW